MNTEITTLAEAELVLRRKGVVLDEMVEGKQLLEICGFGSGNPRETLKRQIEKHNLIDGKDFRHTYVTKGIGRPTKEYRFTVNSANHILLAAMTPEGKAARQDAINTKLGEKKEGISLSDKLVAAEWAIKMLNLDGSAKLGVVKAALVDTDIAPALPSYAIDAPSDSTGGSSEPTSSLSDLLKPYGISARSANKSLHNAGILIKGERKSSSGKTTSSSGLYLNVGKSTART